jgi:hypothetical protein
MVSTLSLWKSSGEFIAIRIAENFPNRKAIFGRSARFDLPKIEDNNLSVFVVFMARMDRLLSDQGWKNLTSGS